MNRIAVHTHIYIYIHIDRYSTYQNININKHVHIYTQSHSIINNIQYIYIYCIYNIRLIFPPTPIRKMNNNFQPLQFLHLFGMRWPLAAQSKTPATESPCGIDCFPFIRILLRFYRWPEEWTRGHIGSAWNLGTDETMIMESPSPPNVIHCCDPIGDWFLIL